MTATIQDEKKNAKFNKFDVLQRRNVLMQNQALVKVETKVSS